MQLVVRTVLACFSGHGDFQPEQYDAGFVRWREGSHAALAAPATHIVAGAGHEIHLFEPSAVITAIADVVRSIREQSKLPPK